MVYKRSTIKNYKNMFKFKNIEKKSKNFYWTFCTGIYKNIKIRETKIYNMLRSRSTLEHWSIETVPL